MIIECRQGWAGLDRVLVQVGKHLLTAVQAFVNEEQYRDIVLAQLGAFGNGFFNGLASVLTVVDQDLGIHRHTQGAQIVRAGVLLKLHIDGDGGCECRKDVILGVFQQITHHFRNARLVQGALGAQLWRYFTLIKTENLRDDPHWAGSNVEGPAGLNAPDCRKRVTVVGIKVAHGVILGQSYNA